MMEFQTLLWYMMLKVVKITWHNIEKIHASVKHYATMQKVIR
jgi:hypothetical protein